MSFPFLWKDCLSDLSNEREYLVLMISAGRLRSQICFYLSSSSLNLFILSSFKDAWSCSESMTSFGDNQICSGIRLYYSFNHWRRQWQPTPVLLSGKSHGWRSLVGCSPWGHWESDRTERLHFHFPLSCIEEGNGNPLQCSCLENPRDRRAWWAAIYGVTEGWTWLKRLSSSSSSSILTIMIFQEIA